MMTDTRAMIWAGPTTGKLRATFFQSGATYKAITAPSNERLQALINDYIVRRHRRVSVTLDSMGPNISLR